MSKSRTVRAAAAQIAPDLTSGEATLARVIETIGEAAGKGAELVVFPETFVPWYPYFSFVMPPVQSGAEHIRLYEHAVVVPSAQTDAVAAAARKHGAGRGSRRQRARSRLALQRAARLRRRRRAQAQAAQDHAHLSRAHDLGAGRRLGPDGRGDGGRPRRRARLLGTLQSARALCSDGAARGDPRFPVSRIACRADLRRADRGDDPAPCAGKRLRSSSTRPAGSARSRSPRSRRTRACRRPYAAAP